MKTKVLLLSALLGASAIASQAQNVTATTDPVGFVTTTIRASSNGQSYAVTPISPVMLAASGVNGTTSGAVTAVGGTTISITSAGWTSSELPTNDVFVLYKSGNLTGLILPVTANTADTLTVSTEGLDLTSQGAAVGDTIQLIQGDTIISMFGNATNGVVGGNSTQFSASQTDKISLTDSTGLTRTYYFNTQFNQWRRSGSSASQDSVRISPTSGAFYSRIGTAVLTMTTTGNVPVTQVKYIVPTSGSRFFARFFPTDGTLNDFGFQNLPGWRSTNQAGVTIATADKVSTVDSSGVLRSYYYDGTNWKRSGSGTSQNTVTVPAGGCVRTTNFGSGSPSIVTVPRPYSL